MTGVKRRKQLGIDSMASLHISGDENLFLELEPCAPIEVTMGNKSKVTTVLKGRVEIHLEVNGEHVSFIVNDVHYHPSFAANLFSLIKLTKQGWEFHSSKKKTSMLSPTGHEVTLNTEHRVSVLQCMATTSVGVGPSQAGQVFNVGEEVDAQVPAAAVTSMESDDLESQVQPNSRVSTTAESDVEGLVRLHARLGHVGFDRMIFMMKKESTLALGKVPDKETLDEARKRVLACTACLRGKGTRTAFGHRGVDKGNDHCETLHMDTFQVKLHRNERKCVEYGLTASDPHGGHAWFKYITTKDQGAKAVIEVVRHAQTQGGFKVKRLYADGGGEFINETLNERFCATEGIKLHWPPAATPKLNSVSERKVRTTKDCIRTMMLHAGVPDRFWHYAGDHAVFVWNRTHISPVTKMTPYEAMYKRKPTITHWGVFGCDAFHHIPKQQRDTFEAKMIPCIYLGHSSVQNCAVVFDLRSNKVVRTRDVVYKEDFIHACGRSGGWGGFRQHQSAG